eukprot:XP_014017230.1 PREDICTED: serine/threonine-protein kinase NIM1-like [Salmo salar]
MTAVCPAGVGPAGATVGCSRGSGAGVLTGSTGGQDKRYARWSRLESSDITTDDEGVPGHRVTPLERLNLDMCQDDRVVRELTLGRRIGFYKVRGEIGCGNFSHVKLGIHALTKGKEDTCQAGNTLTDI